jgi:hypothetical protein
MAEDNLSVSTEPVAVSTPPTQASLVEDISNLLEDPVTDLPEEPEEAAAAPTEDDDPLGLGAEDVENPDDTDTTDESDGPEGEVKGGRFAPDSAKVLFNGQTISIADLKGHVDKRVKEFQRGFTEKTQALSARETEVTQYAQTLEQSREYLTWYAEQFLPKQPEPFKGDARTDPQGFLEWQQQVAQWQTHAQAWQQFQQSKSDEDQRKSGETEKQQQERFQREAEALFKAMPVLKDPVKGKQVWSNIVAGAASLGFSPQEVNGITDHRMVLALRKAIAYDRIKTSAPKVQAEVTRRPVVNNGRRAPASQQASREKQARTERLRSDPSFENGVAALQDFDL